jgi:hypothetical protein
MLSACGAAPAPSLPTALPATSTFTATPAPTNTPKPTNTPVPTPTPLAGSACLEGKWQVTDPAAFIASLTAQTKAAAQVLDDAGPITYQFNPDGTARVTVDQFKLKMKVPLRGLPLNLDVTIDGEATADYVTSEPNQLTFSGAQLDDIQISARVGKQALFAGTPSEMADLFGISLDPLFNSSTYDCRVDTLKYTPLANANEVVLTRVQ